MYRKKLSNFFLLTVFLLIFLPLFACTVCHAEAAIFIRMRIYANFWSLLNKILLIVTIDGIISVGLCYFYLPRRKYTLNAEVLTGHYNQRLLLAAGLLLGTSLAGFIDGILFHQNY